MAVINGGRTAVKEPEAETVEQARERLAQERREAETFAARYGLEFVDMTHFRIDNDLFRRVPFELMLRYGFIPETQLDGRLVGGDGRSVERGQDRRDGAAARPAGRGQGRRALGDRRDPAEVGERPARARRGLRGLPHPARAGGRGRRGGAVDRPHHRRHLADHQAGRLDDVQRHPAPGLGHPHRDARERGDHQVPHRRRALPGDGADRQAAPPDDHQPHQGDVASSTSPRSASPRTAASSCA